MRTDRQRLEDISEAIARIEKYTVKGRAAFDADELVQSWVTKQLLVIGEAAGHVSQSIKDAHPEIPWPKIVGMRNALVHDYFEIDIDAVWNTVQKDLPDLKQEVATLLGAVNSEF